jgi:hypothetical protein
MLRARRERRAAFQPSSLDAVAPSHAPHDYLVFEIAPLNQRPGPPVRIIQIDRAEAAR